MRPEQVVTSAFSVLTRAQTIGILLANLALAQSPLPDPRLTPGAIYEGVTAHDVCQVGYARSHRMNFSIPYRRYIFAEYGTVYVKNYFEVDHLVSLEIGGSNDIRNLWPEPYHTLWNAHVKDALEDRLHEMVCHGDITLAEAQSAIATDWISTYKRVLHVDAPIYAQHISSDRRLR